MATLDYRIVVNILSSAALVPASDFTTPLLCCEGAAFALVLFKEYTSAAAIAADVELNAATQAYATQFFTQLVNGGRLKIAKMAGGAVSYGTSLAALAVVETGFYAVLTDNKTTARNVELATWAQANGRLAVVQSNDADVLTAVAGNDLLDLATFSRAVYVWHLSDTEALDLAWAGYKLAANPDNQATTWANLPGLVGITVDSLTDTERGNAVHQGVAYGNVFMPMKTIPITYPGKTCTGSYIDAIIAGDWLKARTEAQVAQLLMDESAVNSKVPYTQAGLYQIADCCQRWLDRGVKVGHFRGDKDAVGTPYTRVVVPLLSDIPSGTVASRQCTITATAKLTGAIDDTVTFNIVVTNA